MCDSNTPSKDYMLETSLLTIMSSSCNSSIINDKELDRKYFWIKVWNILNFESDQDENKFLNPSYVLGGVQITHGINPKYDKMDRPCPDDSKSVIGYKR